MNKNLPVSASVAGMVLIALLGAGCGGRPESAGTSGGASGAANASPRHGGVLRFAGPGDPPHLDPFDTPSAAFHNQGPGMVYSRLLRYEHRTGLPSLAYTPGPDLAERWEQIDPSTYVFHLRKGVKFQNLAPVNGREVAADDVIYSYNRQREQGRPNAGQLASVAGISAPDKYTIRISLKQPNPDFLIDLTDGHNQVVPRETVELTGDLKNGPNIGSGPWILEKFEKGGATFYKRNPDYFQQPLPYVDRVEAYNNFSDSTSKIAAFRTGKLDVLEGI
ncbi:MAG: ABC transporter substrate-binding protein, partial [Chloroflexota bacterium]